MSYFLRYEPTLPSAFSSSQSSLFGRGISYATLESLASRYPDTNKRPHQDMNHSLPPPSGSHPSVDRLSPECAASKVVPHTFNESDALYAPTPTGPELRAPWDPVSVQDADAAKLWRTISPG